MVKDVALCCNPIGVRMVKDNVRMVKGSYMLYISPCA